MKASWVCVLMIRDDFFFFFFHTAHAQKEPTQFMGKFYFTHIYIYIYSVHMNELTKKLELAQPQRRGRLVD